MTVDLVVPAAITISVSGTQGPRGNGVLSGTGSPAPTTGVNGDWYIDDTDPTALLIYGPKAAGAWGTGQPIGASGGGTPSATVASGTSFGTSSAAGAATEYSRGDHAHGTPAAPTKSTVGLGNVDNTSDAGKPLSTAATAALAAEVTRANAAYDTAGAASTVAGALATHAGASTAVHGIADTAALVTSSDSRLTDSRAPSGTAGGDLSGTYPNPAVARLHGIAVSGTPAVGDVLTATSASAADWQAPSGGGSGSAERWAEVRITDDNLSGLPSAPSWEVVVTSGGTPLQCSIPASVGDRFRVVGRMMYNGAHFLDWVLLDSDGNIAEFAASGTSSPLSEGDPALYPSTSFSREPGPPAFTVGADHIDGDGNITIALAHQGTSAGLVYAHTVYPWRLRLEDAKPAPA